MPESPERSILRQFIYTHCLIFGDFTLSSGQKSNIYLDLRKLTLFGPTLSIAAFELLKLALPVKPEPQVVGGMANGASPIAVTMAMQSVRFGYSIKEATIAYKEDGLVKIANPQPEGTNHLLVDDVISTAKATVSAGQAYQRPIIGAACIVDRQMGGRELLEQTFGIQVLSLFTISDLLEQKPA